MATVARGEDICLQGDKSDVQLHITAGCPKRAHLMEVRTDLSSFASIIPDDECFIAPVVDVLAPAKTDSSAYILRIPHCLTKDDDRANVKVKMWHENRHPKYALLEVPPRDKCTDGVLFYDIDDSLIQLHTNGFCKVLCTVCKTPLFCLSRATSFFFGKFESFEEDATTQHEVQIRPYFCSVPYEVITDFRQVKNSGVILHTLHLALCQQTSCFLFFCCEKIPINFSWVQDFTSTWVDRSNNEAVADFKKVKYLI